MKQELLSYIRREEMTHASIPFWSWNDKLEEDELLLQMKNMKELGMRGFFMHARGGLGTEYMSKDWFDRIRFCIAESKKLGLEAWSYDENGWPSGFGGGELLKDPRNHAAGLRLETSDTFPEPCEEVIGVYGKTENGVKRLDAPDGSASYLVVRRYRDFSYVDIMNPAVTEQFLAYTHERYRRELGEDFGSGMPGFFTDEPQYFRYGTPWSDTFRTTFRERFGYDVEEALPALFLDFEGAESYRYDYYLLCHESFYRGFMKPLYDWCDRNGVQLTGHAIEEWGLGGQMMCCGGVMPFYLYEHLPGIDYLCRDVKNITGARQLGSVCAQTGKKVAMTETFACCGWDVSPREIKRIAELQIAGGVNLICEHLYAYSARGQRKRDFPAHYSEHNPWQKYYGHFVRHIRRLGAALSAGEEMVDTLVLHPIRSAYLFYKREKGDASVKELNRDFFALSDRLSFDQIPFHYGDETILREMGRVEGDAILVGKCRYTKVVLPSSYTLDASTVALLKAYLAGGGRLYLDGRAPDRIDGYPADLSFLVPNMSYAELKASSPVAVTRDGEGVPLHLQIRTTEKGKLLFLANVTAKEYPNTEITVKDCAGLCLLDTETLSYRPLRGKKNPDGSVTVLYDFGDSGSCLLVEGGEAMLPWERTVPRPTVSLGAFTLKEKPTNYFLLDEAELSLNGDSFRPARSIIQIRDNLLRARFEGDVTLRYTFLAECCPSTLRLILEPLTYREVTVNGQALTLCEDDHIDRRFLGAELAPYLKEGSNTVTVTFAYYQREEVYTVLYGGGNEALRNCLSFDTEVEEAYLVGDFEVRIDGAITDGNSPHTFRAEGPYVLTAPTEDIALTDIERNGYLFFRGEITAETTLTYHEGDPTLLRLGGRFSACRLCVNGIDLGIRLFDDTYELKEALREGDNTLTLTLCVSNRNLLGPHHGQDSEMTTVYPRMFSFEKQWDGDACPAFHPIRSFVRHGIGF